MNELNGMRALLFMNLRRDRLLLPICVATFAGVAGSSAAATAGLYPDVATRAVAAELFNATPALLALYGRVYDPTSLGAIGLIKLTAFGVVMVGLFAALVVIRHTRADEELGRYELLAGGSIGRFAALTAALVTAAIGVVGVGLVTMPALIVAGLPVSGSLAFGLAWTVSGLAFAGVGAVAAQLTASARAARGLAVIALAVAYVLRAAGDSIGGPEPAWPSWLSPIGWAQQIRPYAADRWALALAADRLRSGHGGAGDCADPAPGPRERVTAATPGSRRGAGTARRPLRVGVAGTAGRVSRLVGSVRTT